MHRRTRRRPDAAGAPPSVGSAVARFMIGSLVALAVVLVGGFFAVRSVAISEAERDTSERVQAEGRLVEAVGLSDGLLRGSAAAIQRVDDVVQSQVLAGSIVRVKIWSENGRVLYSDVPQLIGQRFTLGAEEQELLHKGGAEAELSDLSAPENRYERPERKLLEAHTPIRTPNGTPVLFEIYQRFSSVSASGERLLRALAPPLVGGLLVLALFQVPLAWSLARRLQRGHSEREALLANAIEASAQERRRIASDLHDGVVQDLAGVAFGLAPLAEEAERRNAPGDAKVLRDSMNRLRQGVRDLRTLLVEIHPPSLESTGLEPALNDLLSPLHGDGIQTDLHVDERASAGSVGDALVYRVAREALRNVQKYADADTVTVQVTRSDGDMTRLVVVDDGRGFSAEDRRRRSEEGHVGLTLLEGLVKQSNGRLSVVSEPGKGTTVELEVPAQ
jgi:two-component system, NarL family, sensor kinase